MPRLIIFSILTFFPLIFSGQVSGIEPAEISFNKHVRPILSDRCFHCHGPDSKNQESSLRLDTAAHAMADLGGYAGIVPGDLEASEIHHRIHSEDDDRMPPLDSNRELSDEEKDILDAWIVSGAKYEKHWAFENLPAEVPSPKTKNTAWSRQPLDRFVLRTLEKQGIEPTQEVAPLRWLRRATFDLTGLPPTSQELDVFQSAVEENPEAAYREAVDRLLGSDAYGEHMAVAWLDAARYADSYGYQSDKLNTQWPYRDWVVRAFNENLPFDDFLIWQLAGDLLENPTRYQKLATAFNRIHRLNNEGGAIFEEWRLENVADRVHTFGTAVLGLTMECCRCHDHKYDPISTRDYYALSAFFNSIDENGLYDRTEKVPSPTMLLPTAEQSQSLQQTRRNLVEAEDNYRTTVEAAKGRYATWRANVSAETLQIPDLLIRLDFDEPFTKETTDQYYSSTNDRAHAAPLDLVEVEDSSLPNPDPSNDPRRAIALDGERGVTIKGIEPFDRWTPFSVVVSLRERNRHPLRAVIAHHTRGTDAGYNGWDLTIENGFVESRLYRVWPGNAIGVRTLQAIPKDKWHQLAATYDGSSLAEGLKLYLNGKLLQTEILRDKPVKSANVLVDHGGELVLGQRFRSRGFADALVDDMAVYARALTPIELQHLATARPITKSEAYFISAIDELSRKAQTNLISAHKAVVMAEEVMQEVPIMEELDEPLETHILARGQYDALTSDDTRVTRDTFSEILPEFPEDHPRDRLGLARWVVDPQHPLTARVLVNRLWANFFSAGLVRTPENFGLQGELPTHPELLDWLARDLVQHDWDVKRFCRNVVLSATYRQDSTASPKLLAADPENRLLARGPAYRLAAEQIRDLVLSASGLLNREQGGPPISPYQPGGDLWKESNVMSPAYEQSVGRQLYRRSVYSVWKRTAPLPNMMAFDTTSREVCSVRRSRTNTPLQALVLLNDIQFVEAARVLAAEVLNEDVQESRPLQSAFRKLTGRTPDEREYELLSKLLDEERAYYQSHPAEAEKLLSLGDSKYSTKVADEDLAAMTVVCQAILNLDATIWKR